MDVELKHHYGWKVHSTDADNLDDAAKQAVRDTHHFLTDTNHTMEAGERENARISWRSVLVFRGEGAPAYSGPRSMETDYWFSVQYRSVRSEASEGDNDGR